MAEREVYPFEDDETCGGYNCDRRPSFNVNDDRGGAFGALCAQCADDLNRLMERNWRENRERRLLREAEAEAEAEPEPPSLPPVPPAPPPARTKGWFRR